MADLTPEQVMRGRDFEDAELAWKDYKAVMRNHPRRQLRKRELIAGYLAGVSAERARQMLYVHPNILRMKELIDLADMRPEEFQRLVQENPEAVRKLRTFLESA